eukprot:SAG31_NODE_11879_length_989_cov_1.044944_1_plen_76_part_10
MVCEQARACEQLLLDSVTNNERCCEPGMRRINCPNGFPAAGQCGTECAPGLIFWWAQCQEVHNGTTIAQQMQVHR